MADRPKPGDVLELTAPNGRVVVHYLGKHRDYGEGIRVCPVVHSDPVDVSADLFKAGYVTFYPVTAAVAHGLAIVVGHLPSPGLPTRLRRAGAREGRLVKTWIIEEDSREVLKQTLSDDERNLPIAAIWNHEFLLQRVAEGWRPEMEGRDA